MPLYYSAGALCGAGGGVSVALGAVGTAAWSIAWFVQWRRAQRAGELDADLAWGRGYADGLTDAFDAAAAIAADPERRS